ncbi:hypothetical protein [Providencia alcalifaciens]|uniref:hypothetical protein n=1 Tax=Providencia alcalifaciens TaxID=126385 RepID=UPI00029C0EEB|nr:hypothetical protein [Providencia alcalifaciens]EKT62142.1 hypothetical protein OO9_18991 [Providencia alcalifaciens Dmel2]EUD08898.1 hypothetical protein HMPREF1564_1586 [Providencia alcalifaciens R90-1475]CAG9406171.1 hypothetical protein NVI2019_PLFLNFOB_00061 [Providencia alcalifaciens]CAG9406186.1 hypothetical protein NVI2019_OHEONHNH_00061 [Providencia alcalifaciens]CAG9406312.1 hypothetical protein NVI2019_KOLGMIGM_00061 [Providencia alcalifaciens]
MNKMKSTNSQILEQIISVNKQQENEFNNGQDGAIILSLLVMFFVPFSLLVMIKNHLGLENNAIAIIAVVALSLGIATGLYKTFKVGIKFVDKRPTLEQLLSRYTPKDKVEYQKLMSAKQSQSQDFYSLIEDWLSIEKRAAI